MSKRKTLLALVLSAFALAALTLFAEVITAQKGTNSVTGVPIRGIDVKLGKNPGGNAAARTLQTDSNGKIVVTGLTPGNYWMEIAPLSTAQKAANAGGDGYNYMAVTIAGDSLVGQTMTRSLEVNKWQFVKPRANTAKTTTPDTYTNRIEFEIKPITGGGTPPPLNATVVKSKSNIYNN
jgi:hypothetical protein